MQARHPAYKAKQIAETTMPPRETSEIEALAIEAADAAYNADYKDSKWNGLSTEDCLTLAMAKGEEAYAAVFAERAVEPAFDQMYWRVLDRRSAEYIAREDARIEQELSPVVTDDNAGCAPRI
jgi:hypothetical protein